MFDEDFRMVLSLYTAVLGLERWNHDMLRKGRFAGGKALCLFGVTVLVLVMPLVVTGRVSFGEAESVCYGWTYERMNLRYNATGMDVEDPLYDPDWSMEDWADWTLFPQHVYNSVATCVSLVGFWVWLCFSAHKNEEAEHLDRTCK